MATQMRFEPSETPFASPRVGSRSTPSAIPSALVHECYDRAREFFALPSDVKKCYLHTQYEQETGGCVRASRPASSATPRGRSPVSHPRVNAHVTSSSFITERFCSRLVQSSRRRLTLVPNPRRRARFVPLFRRVRVPAAHGGVGGVFRHRPRPPTRGRPRGRERGGSRRLARRVPRIKNRPRRLLRRRRRRRARSFRRLSRAPLASTRAATVRSPRTRHAWRIDFSRTLAPASQCSMRWDATSRDGRPRRTRDRGAAHRP